MRNAGEQGVSRIEKNIFTAATLMLVFGLILSLLFFGGVVRIPEYPCLFKLLTHLYCPGCGGTRALQYMLTGHFLKSLMANPSVIYCSVLFLWYYLGTAVTLITGGRVRIFHPSLWMLVVFLCLFAGFFILRNVFLVFLHVDMLGDLRDFW